MIKLPILLETVPDAQQRLALAIDQREQLDAPAKRERAEPGTPYLRPLVLIQAEKRPTAKETRHVDWVKNKLITNHNIPEAEIVIEKDLHRDLDLAYVPEHWTEARLAAWFCRQISDPSITHASKTAFVEHYYPRIGDFDSKEEYLRACWIDRQPEVVFSVRNLVRKNGAAFFLQKADGRFFPDFVCKHADGHILVVEYQKQRPLERRQVRPRNRRAVGGAERGAMRLRNGDGKKLDADPGEDRGGDG